MNFRAEALVIADRVLMLHTDNPWHSGGVIDIADSGTVDVDVNRGAGEIACVLGPGAVDIGAITSSGLLDGCEGGMAVAVLGSGGSFVDGTPGLVENNMDRVTLTTSWAMVRRPGKAAYRGRARARSTSVLLEIRRVRMESFLRAPALVFGLVKVGWTPSPPVGVDMPLQWYEWALTPPSFCSLLEPSGDVHGAADPGMVKESGLAGNGDDGGQ